ncbi:MAG: glycosyltransferase family 39 protein [Kiritimatiellae bacterium]|nr:glycosyltransferase family 39 protein [Kiritimatiellia bacterium]
MIFNRTFHPDEANQAFTTGRLLETGMYRYNPADHHGPTLYYAAAAIQKAAGCNTTASLDAALLRTTPLLFALLSLVFIFLSFKKILGKRQNSLKLSLLPVLLTATAPVFVFFATDFIQEMLLLGFTSMMLWAMIGYSSSRKSKTKVKPGSWMLFLGISAGMAFATKETAILSFAALLASVSAILFSLHGGKENETALSARPDPSHILLAASGFLLTATLFYSSFASNWQGVYDAFAAAPLSYVRRAMGSSASDGASYHIHPWYQYSIWLFKSNVCFSLFAATGILAGISALKKLGQSPEKPLISLQTAFKALSIYTVALTALYSLIPYKTPWCALQIYVPLLLSAFAGLAIFSFKSKIGKIALIALCTLLLAENSVKLAKLWSDPDSKSIPYNYASASPEVKEMANLIRRLVASNETNAKNFIAVAIPSEDTWPLPFYLRDLDANIGYWTRFEELEVLAALKRKPDIVIVPAEDGHKIQPLFPHLKNTKRFEMRHRVRMRVFW